MITEKDLHGINTYGFQYSIDMHGYLNIDLPNVKISIHKRNFYCDRGRFGFNVQVKEGHHNVMNIDFADAFPRYFFKLQRAFDEMKDWVDFNAKILGVEDKEYKSVRFTSEILEGGEVVLNQLILQNFNIHHPADFDINEEIRKVMNIDFLPDTLIRIQSNNVGQMSNPIYINEKRIIPLDEIMKTQQLVHSICDFGLHKNVDISKESIYRIIPNTTVIIQLFINKYEFEKLQTKQELAK